jgi:hypothetical protein
MRRIVSAYLLFPVSLSTTRCLKVLLVLKTTNHGYHNTGLGARVVIKGKRGLCLFYSPMYSSIPNVVVSANPKSFGPLVQVTAVFVPTRLAWLAPDSPLDRIPTRLDTGLESLVASPPCIPKSQTARRDHPDAVAPHATTSRSAVAVANAETTCGVARAFRRSSRNNGAPAPDSSFSLYGIQYRRPAAKRRSGSKLGRTTAGNPSTSDEDMVLPRTTTWMLPTTMLDKKKSSPVSPFL